MLGLTKQNSPNFNSSRHHADYTHVVQTLHYLMITCSSLCPQLHVVHTCSTCTISGPLRAVRTRLYSSLSALLQMFLIASCECCQVGSPKYVYQVDVGTHKAKYQFMTSCSCCTISLTAQTPTGMQPNKDYMHSLLIPVLPHNTII